jgi:hypothetical protein
MDQILFSFFFLFCFCDTSYHSTVGGRCSWCCSCSWYQIYIVWNHHVFATMFQWYRYMCHNYMKAWSKGIWFVNFRQLWFQELTNMLERCVMNKLHHISKQFHRWKHSAWSSQVYCIGSWKTVYILAGWNWR